MRESQFFAIVDTDQLTAVNGTAVLTDANGNVTQDESGGLYTWDVRGRLSSLARSGTSSVFGYNQDDLRVSKTVGSTQTTYLLDGDNVVRESANGVSTDLLQGPGTDNLLARGGLWFTPSNLGSSSTITDSSGNWLQRYDYAPFGQVTVSVGAGPAQPYQFTGREADESGLMYYRARYYNPGWGRFVSADPLGVGGAADIAHSASVRDQTRIDDRLAPGAPGAVAREDSAAGSPFVQGDPARVWRLGVHPAGPAWAINPYAYAGDNPVNNSDPSGQTAAPWQVFVLGVRAVFSLFYTTVHGVNADVGVPWRPVVWPTPVTQVIAGPGPGGGPEPPGGGGSGGVGGGSVGSGGGLGAIGTIVTGLGVGLDGAHEVIQWRNRIQTYMDPDGNWW